MVTDDPGTPGPGNWEINLGSIASHTADGWLIEALDADINYGWGERIQLKLDAPYNTGQVAGHWQQGAGSTLLGVKWRYFDAGAWTASIYPQWSFSPDPSAVRRGVADPGHTLILPAQVATHVGTFDLDFEFGRAIVPQGPNEWFAGAILAHECGEKRECMLEVRNRFSAGDGNILVNLGVRWELAPGYTLLAAAGREFGTIDAGLDLTDGARVNALFYLGVQVTR